jgi:hypothetical protein
VVPKIPTDKVLQDTQAETQCFQLSHPTVVVVVDHGTAMLLVLAAQAAAAVQDLAVVDQTIIPDPTIVATQTWVVGQLLVKDSPEVQASDLTVKVKTVTKQVAVAEQVDLDSVQKMTATKAAWAKVVQEQPTIF